MIYMGSRFSPYGQLCDNNIIQYPNHETFLTIVKNLQYLNSTIKVILKVNLGSDGKN